MDPLWQHVWPPPRFPERPFRPLPDGTLLEFLRARSSTVEPQSVPAFHSDKGAVGPPLRQRSRRAAMRPCRAGWLPCLSRILSHCLLFTLATLFVTAGLREARAQAPVPPTEPLSGPIPTQVTVRVVAHKAMVIGDEVGGARVTITDTTTGTVLASGLQQGDAGDQTQIMRTPRLMEETHYSTRPAAAFRATLSLDKPTLVEISAQGPLAYPHAQQKVSKTVLLIPGRDITGDGIPMLLHGFIVQIEQPTGGDSLIAKEDVRLRASIRTLSGAPVRPYSDWDSRKIKIYAEIVIGDRIVERLQMFYAGAKGSFEAPFFVPTPAEAPDGFTIRVIAADESAVNVGMAETKYPVLTERLRPRRNER